MFIVYEQKYGNIYTSLNINYSTPPSRTPVPVLPRAPTVEVTSPKRSIVEGMIPSPRKSSTTTSIATSTTANAVQQPCNGAEGSGVSIPSSRKPSSTASSSRKPSTAAITSLLSKTSAAVRTSLADMHKTNL